MENCRVINHVLEVHKQTILHELSLQKTFLIQWAVVKPREA
jgi:hypothetical protein